MSFPEGSNIKKERLLLFIFLRELHSTGEQKSSAHASDHTFTDKHVLVVIYFYFFQMCRRNKRTIISLLIVHLLGRGQETRILYLH